MNKPTAEELKLLLREQELKLKVAAQDNFLNFVRVMWPEFVKGPHHLKTAAKLQDLADGKIDIIIGTHALLADSIKFKNPSFTSGL